MRVVSWQTFETISCYSHDVSLSMNHVIVIDWYDVFRFRYIIFQLNVIDTTCFVFNIVLLNTDIINFNFYLINCVTNNWSIYLIVNFELSGQNLCINSKLMFFYFKKKKVERSLKLIYFFLFLNGMCEPTVGKIFFIPCHYSFF